MFVGGGHDGFHVARRAGHVNRQNQPGPGGDLLPKVFRVHGEAFIHFAENGNRVDLYDGRYGGHPHETGHDHLTARPNSQGTQGHDQGPAAAVDRQGVLRAVEFPRRGFQPPHVFRLARSVVAKQRASLQHVQDGSILLLVQPVDAGELARPIDFHGTSSFSTDPLLDTRAVQHIMWPLARQRATAGRKAVREEKVSGTVLGGRRTRV